MVNVVRLEFNTRKNHQLGSCAHLEEAEELLGQNLGDGRELALSDLVPLVSVGGERLRPRSADHRQGQSKDVRLC